MKKIIRIILFNVLVLFSLLIILDFISALTLDSYSYYRSHVKNKPVIAESALLPNYENFLWAAKHFEELGEVRAEYRSYYGWRRLPFDGITVHIDSNGIRKTIKTSFESENAPITIFLGGSTIWGSGSSDEFTIPSLFSLKLDGKYNVINYGETAYCAYQEYQFLQLQIIKGINPQLVISYDGVNNSPAFIENYSHMRDKQFKSLINGADRPKVNKLYLFKPTLDIISKIKNRFFFKSQISINKAPVFTKERNREAAIELLESWLLIWKLCSSVGANYICVLQPNSFVGNPKTENISK